MPLLLAAAVLVVAVVGAVMLFGVKRPPALASLRESPDPAPPAAIAWTDSGGDDLCIHVARPDGTVTQIRCEPLGGELLGWPDDDRLVLARHDGHTSVADIHPVTGEVLEVRAEDGDAEPVGPPPSDPVTSYRDDGALVVEHDGTELWRVAAPDGYDVHSSSESPDGTFVVMTDTAERLLVVPADGSRPPRIWADDVQSWTIPVWQGEVGQTHGRAPESPQPSAA
jgi:hypothetical protein